MYTPPSPPPPRAHRVKHQQALEVKVVDQTIALRRKEMSRRGEAGVFSFFYLLVRHTIINGPARPPLSLSVQRREQDPYPQNPPSVGDACLGTPYNNR